MEKLSELSKPVAWRYRYTKPGITDSHGEAWVGDWKFVTDEVNCNPAPNYQRCALYSQEYVSALLAELEAKDKRIGELEFIATEYAGKFQKAQDANKHLIIMSNDDKKRIAELEAKLATPVRLLGEMLLHDWEHSVERQATFQHRKIAWDARLAEDKKAILAAGFTFTVEGDE